MTKKWRKCKARHKRSSPWRTRSVSTRSKRSRHKVVGLIVVQAMKMVVIVRLMIRKKTSDTPKSLNCSLKLECLRQKRRRRLREISRSKLTRLETSQKTMMVDSRSRPIMQLTLTILTLLREDLSKKQRQKSQMRQHRRNRSLNLWLILSCLPGSMVMKISLIIRKSSSEATFLTKVGRKQRRKVLVIIDWRTTTKSQLLQQMHL